MPTTRSKKGNGASEPDRAKSSDEEEFVPDEVEGDGEEQEDEEEVENNQQQNNPDEDDESVEDDKEPAGDANDAESDQSEEDKEESDVGEEGDDDNKEKAQGTKRSKTNKSQSGSNKKQKSSSSFSTNGKSKAVDTSQPNGAAEAGKVGSRHDDPRDPNTRGSADRLPEVGQQVHWKALPGYVDGEVVEILKEEKDVDGKKVKASEKDPRIVLKSNKSGKICVHKADAVYFEAGS